ncbi:MAG: TetR family transcriptional regulator [Myxococcota bacterium]
MEEQTVDQKGRPLGRRALETRRRLLNATADLLAKRGLREIRVVEIARKVGTSPATFYQYFRDVEQATLALAADAADQMPSLDEYFGEGWEDGRGMDAARGIVDAFIQHWDDHQAVLRIRNLAADEGEERFRRVRQRALRPILDQFAAHIREAQRQGRISREINDYAAAAALAAILERLATYHSELESLGVTRRDLIETSARILYQTLTGHSAP